MADGSALRAKLIALAVDGPAKAPTARRAAAYEGRADESAPIAALLDKVARHAFKVTDEDVAAAKAAGATEDELFELAVVAALGQASRQLDAALAALAEAQR